MPIFDYTCDRCGHTNEKMISVDAADKPPIFMCTKCDGTMRKQIGAPAVHFKGAGFPGNDMKNGK